MLNMIGFSTNCRIQEFSKFPREIVQPWLSFGFRALFILCVSLHSLYSFTCHCTKGTMNLTKHRSLAIKSSVMGNVN